MAFADDIITWSLTATMKSAYSAQITLTNQESSYGKSLRMSPISVGLTCSADIVNVSGTSSLFTGDRTWINGLISNVENHEGISERGVSLDVKSFFARLAKRPIHTHVILGTTLTALAVVAVEYIGIPLSLFNFTIGEYPMVGPVNGSNTFDEMKRITQAGHGMLYVDDTGTLVARPWKNILSAVDVTIPTEAIVSAQMSRGSESIPSRIKVRGAYFSEYEAGEQNMTDSKSESGTGIPSGSGGTGPLFKCFINGLEDRILRFINRNVRGNPADWANAQIQVPANMVPELIRVMPERVMVNMAVQDPSGDSNYTSGSSGTYVNSTSADTGTPGIVAMAIVGQVRPQGEVNNPALQNRPLRDLMAAENRELKTVTFAFTGHPKSDVSGPAGGGGAPNKGGNKTPDQTADKSVEIQLEVYVVDPDLFDEFGLIDEEIENPYVNSMESLFDIAVQRFQELKMERNSWELQTAYLPGVHLNQVVTFTTPPLKDGSTKTVTGLLVGIKVDYSPDPKVKMTLTVESFEDCGATTYVSSNIALDSRMVGIGTTAWSIVGANASVGNGRGLIYSPVGYVGNNGITLTQSGMEVGATYTLFFEISKFIPSGIVPVKFSAVDATGVLGLNSYSTDFSASFTFVARHSITAFNWYVEGTTTEAGWSVFLPRLFKSVVR
jgi:hypothetical protein